MNDPFVKNALSVVVALIIVGILLSFAGILSWITFFFVSIMLVMFLGLFAEFRNAL